MNSHHGLGLLLYIAKKTTSKLMRKILTHNSFWASVFCLVLSVGFREIIFYKIYKVRAKNTLQWKHVQSAITLLYQP